MTAILNQKDFNRTDFIKTLQDCFLMDGNDPKLGRLGSTLMVDLLSMKRKAKHRIYCRKMEHLSKAVWFTTILVKLKEHTKKSFQKVPPSLYKFLSVIHVILMYGWSLSVELFWSLMEKTIEPQDQKEIVVHRTIKAIREYLKISPEVFMQYLDSHGIQPCSELLAQIREIKQKKTRAARAQQLKQRVIGMYSPRIKATLQKSLQVDVQSTDEPNISSLPNQKYLSMIREQSESTNYGIEYNSLTPMRKEIGAKKVMFAPNMSDMVEESSEIHFDEGYDGYDDQLSPLGSIMSLETENPETIEIQIPKKS